jgi:hypothetical protein
MSCECATRERGESAHAGCGRAERWMARWLGRDAPKASCKLGGVYAGVLWGHVV